MAIRSSSNLEDLDNQAGAGLFDSYLNIDIDKPEEIIKAIVSVWASTFNLRALINRRKLKIESKNAQMGVIIMQMINPEFSFVIHTKDPINSKNNNICIELCIGSGETLASSNQKGSPFRLSYNKETKEVNILNLASFMYKIDEYNKKNFILYKEIKLMNDLSYLKDIVSRIGEIGSYIESKSKSEDGSSEIPQDIEGNFQDSIIYIVQTRPQII